MQTDRKMDEPTIPMRRLSDMLECSICMEVFRDPRSLPCIHTFCLKCIAALVKDKLPLDTATCPICRKEFTIPGKGVEDLPRNIFVTRVMSSGDLQQPADLSTKLCDMCGNEGGGEEVETNWDKTAVAFCLDCQENMCKTCSALHRKMKVTSSHRTINYGQSSDKLPLELKRPLNAYCDKHRDKRLEIFCHDCRTAVCMMCFILQHKDHKSAEIVEVAEEFRKKMARDSSAVGEVSTRLTHLIGVLDKDKETFVERVRRIEVDIRETADKLRSEIDIQEQQLTRELAAIKANRLKEVENLAQEIRQDVSMMDGLRKYCLEVIENGSDSDATREVNVVHERVVQMAKVDETIQQTVESLSFLDLHFERSDLGHNFIGQLIEYSPFRGIVG